MDATALFYAHTSQYSLWVTQEGMVFDSVKKIADDKSPSDLLRDAQYKHNVSHLNFINANPHPKIGALNPTQHKVNYLTANDRSKWKTGISTSKAILYTELYPHIDLKIYGVEQEIEYDFIVKPGGEVADISFEYKGVDNTNLDGDGNLIVETEFCTLNHTRPVAYQIIQEERIEVKARFRRIDDNLYGFQVGRYDLSHELIIDPIVIVYSTYLGGGSLDQSVFAAVDSYGAVYLTGWVESKNFPTANALFPNFGGGVDAFVIKIAPDGNELVYSTYLGGSDRDGGLDIVVDEAGAVYLTGMTKSSDFPTQSPIFGDFKGNWDGFVTKLDASGNFLIYSTYLGGSDFEVSRGIAVDKKGRACVTGLTWSSDFPTKKAFQKKNAGRSDIVLTKLNSQGNGLVFSTYLGGSDEEAGVSIVVDHKNHLYVTGGTLSRDFPTLKAFQKKLAGGWDSYALKLHKSGKKLVYSTYLGGSGEDRGRGIAVDRKGNLYVSGHTSSANFPTKNPIFATLSGDFDIYAAKFKPKGKKLNYSTYLGGKKVENAFDLAINSQNQVFVRGYTESKNFPTKAALFNKYQGNGDVVVAQIAENGEELLFSTFLGGSGADLGYGIAIDIMDAVYIVGGTESKDFPVKNPIQKNKRKKTDIFVTKLVKQ